MSSPFSRKTLITEALILNAFIFLLVVINKSFYTVVGAGGLLIVLYLVFKALVEPVRTFFLIFGIKLTFDALWFVKLPLPVLGQYGLLHLFLIPFVILIFLGPQLSRQHMRWPVWFAFGYLLWVIIVMVLNDFKPEIEIMIRQSGLFLGLLIGLRYIKSQEDFDRFLYLIFISTVIPVLASTLQLAIGQMNITLFNYKFDTTLLYRPAGLYYDPGTTGIVNIVSLLSNAYLLQTRIVKGRLRTLHLIFIPLSFMAIISGGTRSMIGVAFLILIVLFLKNMKQNLRVVFLILVIGVFSAKPYIDGLMKKSSRDVKRKIEITEIFSETDYRTMFTGRIGIWQDILHKFNDGTILQKLFGTGLSSNAHSTYFFLLLQIGFLGLIFFIVFHVRLLATFWIGKISNIQRTIALLSLLSVMLIGFSLTTVIYTSFQWFIYTLIGSELNMKYPGQNSDPE